MRNPRDVAPLLPARLCRMQFRRDGAQRSAHPTSAINPVRAVEGALSCAVATTADTFIMHLYGDIDIAAERVFSGLSAALTRRRPTRLVVEAKDITFIDCAGYRLLLAVQTAVEAHGGTVVLRAPSPAVSRLTSLFPMGVRRIDAALHQPCS